MTHIKRFGLGFLFYLAGWIGLVVAHIVLPPPVILAVCAALFSSHLYLIGYALQRRLK